MKSRSYFKYSKYVVMTGAIAAALVGCSKGAQENRRIGVNANAPIPGTAPIGPNGIYMINNIPCNINDTNPQSVTSPYYAQGPCYNPNIMNQVNQQQTLPQQQVVNQIPPGQQMPVGPQQQFGPQQAQQQGPLVSPNYGIPQTNDDIPRDGVGRIVDKQIQLASGIGIQDAKDTCAINKEKLDSDDLDQIHYNSDGSTTYHYARFLTPPNVVVGRGLNDNLPSDRFDFWFDHSGALRISAQSYIMQAATSQLIHPVVFDPSNPPGPLEYALDPSTKTLHVGPFSMTGPVSDLFAQHEKYLAEILKHDKDLEDKKTYDIDSSVPEFATQDYQSGPQGQQTFMVGQGPSANHNQNSSSNFAFRPQNGGSAHNTSPNFVTMSVGQVVANIGLLLPINTQHITGLYVEQVQWHAHINIDTILGLNKCIDDADGSFVHVFMK